MGKFHLTDQGGAQYEIDAPNETAAVAALAHATGRAKADAGAAPIAQGRGALETVDDYVRALANGMTFGLADRFAAGMGSATGIGGKSGDYAGNLKEEQRRTDQFEHENPVAAIGTNLAGGALVPLGAIGAASRATTMGGKIAAGAGAGSVLGGAQGAFSSKDLTDIPQTATNAAIGAGAGAVIGGAIPPAARVIGAGYNRAADFVRGQADGMSRGASKHLVDALMADGPPAVPARMAKLGDDAMLADAGPAFLGKAMGASLNSDEGRSVLQGALTARNEGTNQRIMADINRALGPAEDPQTVTNAIRARRAEVDALHYPAALDRAPPVETAPILQQLDGMIKQSPVGSMENKALTNLKEMMLRKEKQPLLDAEGYPQYDKLGNERFRDVPVSENDASILHKVKGELDNVIEYDAPGLGVPAGALQRQQGALKHFRGELNSALENQVPGYLEANRQSAALARRGEAVQLGTQYLGAGKTTASPGRFADEFSRLEPGEQIAFAKGSRGNIERALGTKANDLQALRSELQGEGGWNTAKIATVHGQDAADDLVATVDRNLKFRDTHHKVVENSQTAQRQAAANAMKPVPPGEVPLINPNMTTIGLLLGGLKKGAKATYDAARPDQTRAYGEIADILTAQGAPRDAHLQSLIGAVDRRGRNASAAPVVGDRAALVAAIMAHGYARGGPRRNRE